MKKEIQDTIKNADKPAPFIAFGSTEPITNEEIEYENPYKVEALEKQVEEE